MEEQAESLTDRIAAAFQLKLLQLQLCGSFCRDHDSASSQALVLLTLYGTTPHMADPPPMMPTIDPPPLPGMMPKRLAPGIEPTTCPWYPDLQLWGLPLALWQCPLGLAWPSQTDIEQMGSLLVLYYLFCFIRRWAWVCFSFMFKKKDIPLPSKRIVLKERSGIKRWSCHLHYKMWK